MLTSYLIEWFSANFSSELYFVRDEFLILELCKAANCCLSQLSVKGNELRVLQMIVLNLENKCAFCSCGCYMVLWKWILHEIEISLKGKWKRNVREHNKKVWHQRREKNSLADDKLICRWSVRKHASFVSFAGMEIWFKS